MKQLLTLSTPDPDSNYGYEYAVVDWTQDMVVKMMARTAWMKTFTGPLGENKGLAELLQMVFDFPEIKYYGMDFMEIIGEHADTFPEFAKTLEDVGYIWVPEMLLNRIPAEDVWADNNEITVSPTGVVIQSRVRGTSMPIYCRALFMDDLQAMLKVLS